MHEGQVNEFGQPVGEDLPGWTPLDPLPSEFISGHWCTLEPLRVDHATALHQAWSVDEGSMWTYMPWGPFASTEQVAAVIEWISLQPDWSGYAVLTPASGPAGMACHLRIDTANGVVEVGAIAFAPVLRRSTAATEALVLMAERAFAAGFRRYEWKCDSLNAPSRRAAERLGFAYEGTFRQAMVYKGRNRDTSWYSITDDEWPAMDDAYRKWLDPANFDGTGRQLSSLSDLVPRAGDRS